MRTRTLDSTPRILPLYARAAAALLPGASLLPSVPGGGGEVPELELRLDGVRPEPEKVAAYSRVCGFPLRDSLPITYPHVLAFPLHLATIADGGFPFGGIGLVHLENRIAQRRPIGIGEELELTVRPTPLQPHRRGRTFSLLTEARVGDELAWESVSTMLRRGGGGESALDPAMRAKRRTRTETELGVPAEDFAASAQWRLDGDLGRRYAAVSGDRNPIHMHSLTARPLGFPAAIAHGMWTKARALAALGSRLPDALEAEARFRQPIPLPATVEFGSRDGEGGAIELSVRNAERHTPHLDGRVRPLADEPKAEKAGRKAK